MKKRTLPLLLLLFGIGTACFTLTEPTLCAAASSNVNDIFNGARGQLFNQNWKFQLGEASNAQKVRFDDSAWQSLTLPHDWSISLPFNENSLSGAGGGYLDGGIGWYRKTFSIPRSYSGQRVTINFDGVYMNSKVWINGHFLGTRPYGYVSFEYDLSAYLNYGGQNVLAVRVDNTQPNSRWYSGSGIYRNVWLTVTKPLCFDYCGLLITTPAVNEQSASVHLNAKIVNHSSSNQTVHLVTALFDAHGQKVASGTTPPRVIGANNSLIFNQDLTIANPQLWSTAKPELYTAKTQVRIGNTVTDTFQSTFGIRTIAIDPTSGFRLNGSPMKLNGVCLHHDLGSLGAAVNYRAIERQLKLMKAMGCNAIRTSHNPPDPALLEICDHLGLLVIDEAFDAWRESNKNANDYNLYFESWAKTDIQSMVRRDRNHPSVIMYSIGNEVHDVLSNTGLTDAQNLINWINQEDPTRIVTIASNYNEWGGWAINDRLGAVGYNYGPKLYDNQHMLHPNWCIYGSETSSALRSRGVYKLPTDENILTDTDYHCSSYDNSVVSWGSSAEKSYQDTNSRAFVAGEFIWTGFDYIGEPTPYSWPAKSSYFGIVDTCGFPKDIYYFYQSRWNNKPVLHLLPHWNWTVGKTIPVWAYTNCDSVELFLNGTSLGSQHFLPDSPLHLAWEVPYAAGTLRAVGKKNGVVVAVDEVRTAGTATRVVLKPERQVVKSNGVDLIYIETDIVDANHTLVPDASNTVTFGVTGPGRIVGVDNGNPVCHESYKGTRRSAFSGKCLVIVQTTKTAGSIIVTAKSSGLESGRAQIRSNPQGEYASIKTIKPEKNGGEFIPPFFSGLMKKMR